jgi:hypothetical protein
MLRVALRILDRHPRWFAGLLIIHTAILISLWVEIWWLDIP